VLIDQEMVYAPRLSNDRLLLGLKGSLNEYELDLLRQHSVEAHPEKARRGELLQAPLVGYIKTEDQAWKKSGPAGATGYPSCLPQVHELGTVQNCNSRDHGRYYLDSRQSVRKHILHDVFRQLRFDEGTVNLHGEETR